VGDVADRIEVYDSLSAPPEGEVRKNVMDGLHRRHPNVHSYCMVDEEIHRIHLRLWRIVRLLLTVV